ncbi:MerC domain-containing protein [Sphingomonas sp. PB2P12]|uniref:MerC domain-containing protein n=1 Tax=Sphingomonas sandaracina TaxID=3096157 RepID=UPI002FCC46BC
MRNMQTQRMDWLDRAAMAGSAVCMVHCLVLPLILAAVPAVAAVVVVPASFHIWVLVFAVPTAAIALLGGRSRHAVSWPLLIGAAGLGLMTLGAFAIPEGDVEIGVTVAGGILVAIAHIANLRLRHSCCA